MLGDKCARCRGDGGNPISGKGWFTHGWTTKWQQGRFWFCPDCLNEILGWWIDLTATIGEEDPTQGKRARKR